MLRRGSEYVAVALLTAMFAVFLLQVFFRYVLNSPLSWTVEACLILYIWTVFWTAAFVLRERDHVAFVMVYDMAAPQVRRVMAILGTLLVGLGFGAALPAIADFVAFMRIDVTPVTRIRFDIVFSVFVLFAAAVVLRAVATLWRLGRPGWRAEVGSLHTKS